MLLDVLMCIQLFVGQYCLVDSTQGSMLPQQSQYGSECGYHIFFFFFDQKGQFISARGHSGPSSKSDTDFGEARVCIRAAARDCAPMVSH